MDKKNLELDVFEQSLVKNALCEYSCKFAGKLIRENDLEKRLAIKSLIDRINNIYDRL